MRVASVWALGLILTGLSLGCGRKDNPTPAPEPTQGTPAEGTASLDGTYLLTKDEFGPFKTTAEEMAKEPEARRTIVIKGDKLTHAMKDKPQTWAIKLDAGKTPREITVTETPASGKPAEYPGIYQIEGDTLTILLGMDKASGRPKTFTPSDKTLLLVMKKSGKSGPPPAPEPAKPTPAAPGDTKTGDARDKLTVAIAKGELAINGTPVPLPGGLPEFEKALGKPDTSGKGNGLYRAVYWKPLGVWALQEEAGQQRIVTIEFDFEGHTHPLNNVKCDPFPGVVVLEGERITKETNMAEAGKKISGLKEKPVVISQWELGYPNSATVRISGTLKIGPKGPQKGIEYVSIEKLK